MYLPEPLPEGDDLRFKVLYNWLNRMRDYVKSITPQPGRGTRLTRTSTGHIYSVMQQAAGVSTQFTDCMVTELFSAPGSQVDYIGVTKWDPVNLALVGSQFYCAKNQNACQPAVETIDGIVITYSNYSGDTQRQASFTIDGAAQSEWHAIHRRYIVYSAAAVNVDLNQTLITVGEISNGTGMIDPDGNPITYRELTDHQWAYNPGLNGLE